VHRDVEDTNCVVFLEHWVDRDVLLAHFAVPASREFVRALGPLAAEPAEIEIYDATVVDL
jgi:quinol monooxygenase YgiN